MSRLLCCLLLSAGLGLALPLHAQALFRLEAPADVLPLLKAHLPADMAGPGGDLDDGTARLGVLRRLRQAIPALLAVEGYFSPQLDIDPDVEPMRVVVTPGPRAQIKSVRLSFTGAVTEDARYAQRIERWRRVWDLPEGQPFRQVDWNEAKEEALRRVSARDFPLARLVESRAEVDTDKAEVHLSLAIDSGPAFRLGKLEIRGVSDYPASLVERYNLLQEGEPYSQERLLQLQSALQGTPYFSGADVSIDPDPAQAAHATVRVLVVEAKPRGVTLGTGYSTNTGFRGQVDYRNANWWGSALQLNSGLSLEQKRQAASADIYLPPEEGMLQYSVGGLVEHSYIERLDSSRVLLGVARTKPRGDIETRIGLSAQAERNKPDEGDPTRASALALNWSWTRRHVNNLISPRRGYVLNVQFGGGLQLLLSDANFVRSYGRLTYYWPLAERDVLITRAEGGYTQTKNPTEVPQEFLFRTGGAQTVRGYDYLSLGAQSGAAVVGGRYLAVMSVEHNHWFDERWASAVFADAGNAGNDLDKFKLKKSVGVGVRFRTPAGPIAFDLGYALDDRTVRPHISIAIAF